MTYPVALSCPACEKALVTMQADSWLEGRCVYVDEPVRCTRGCYLQPAQVEQLLREAYRRQDALACQLTLPLGQDKTPQVA